MNYEEIIKDFLSKCNGRIVDVLYELYNVILSFDENEQPKALKFLCENFFEIESDLTYSIDKNYYSDEQITISLKRLVGEFDEYIKKIAMDYSKKELDPMVFYENIWGYIQSSRVCKSKRDRAIALALLVKNEFVPFMSVGIGLNMTNEKYNTIIDSIGSEKVQHVEYIMSVEYNQLTQRASLLIDELSSLETKEEKTVLLALILENLENRIKNKIQEYLEKV